MTSDLRPCCQQALLDHWAVCAARRALSAPCTCGHVEVLHGIRGNGTRGACAISTGAKAVPCGCKSFEAAPARLSPAPAVQDTAPLADDPGVGKTSEVNYDLPRSPGGQSATDAAPEGIDLKNAWASSADTASTPAEAPDGA